MRECVVSEGRPSGCPPEIAGWVQLQINIYLDISTSVIPYGSVRKRLRWVKVSLLYHLQVLGRICICAGEARLGVTCPVFSPSIACRVKRVSTLDGVVGEGKLDRYRTVRAR